MITTYDFKKDIDAYMNCDKIIQLEEFDIVLNANIVNSIMLTKCENYQGLK